MFDAVASDRDSAIKWLNGVLNSVRQCGQFSRVPTATKTWVNISATTSATVHYSIARKSHPNTVKVGLFFETDDESINERMLISLEKYKLGLEKSVGMQIIWGRKIGTKRRFAEFERPADLGDRPLRDWTVQTLLKFHDVCQPFLTELGLTRK